MKKQLTLAERNARLHWIGRLWMGISMLYICTIPVWMGLSWKVTPDWSVFATSAVISPLILMALSGIAEPIVYAPMVGINGMYLSFVTGNLSNLKIPCVVKAQEIVGTKPGTEESEIVATLAVAVSSLVTILIIGVMVLCLAFANLQELIESQPYLPPAFATVVYALFGSLGGKYIVKNPKLAAFPLIISVAIAVVLGFMGANPGSAYLFVGIAVTLVFALVQFFREKKKLREKEERLHLAAIAAGMSDDKSAAIDEKLEIMDKQALGKKLTEIEVAVLEGRADAVSEAEGEAGEQLADLEEKIAEEKQDEEIAVDLGEEEKPLD